MKVKNNGRKIIGFGQTSVLPGETVEIPDTFKGNATLETFKALGYIEVVADKPAKTEKTDKGNKGGKGKGEETPTEPPADNGEGATE